MNDRPSGQVERPVNSLADLRLSSETLDSVLGHVGRLGVETLQGWVAVAASIVEGDRIATFGITDDSVRPIDQRQYDTGKGPCVDALRQGEPQYFDGTTDVPRWRQFAEAAAAQGVYSVVSFPMTIDGDALGALNFYSKERDALRPGQKEEGSLFAAQAAVAVANAREFEARGAQVHQLEDGLETRTMIGQATGLVMAEEGITSEEAFQKLVKVSQASNVKLRDIAQKYVQAWEEESRNRTPEDA